MSCVAIEEPKRTLLDVDVARYRSLNTNLIHCSDLGRKAFRNAEERMKRVSSIAEAVCEPGGTVSGGFLHGY